MFKLYMIRQYCCPYCNDRQVLSGFNSIADKQKSMLKEWDYINNYLLVQSENVLETSNKIVWWNRNKCKRKYLMSPGQKTINTLRKKNDCPYSKGYRRKERHFV